MAEQHDFEARLELVMEAYTAPVELRFDPAAIAIASRQPARRWWPWSTISTGRGLSPAVVLLLLALLLAGTLAAAVGSGFIRVPLTTDTVLVPLPTTDAGLVQLAEIDACDILTAALASTNRPVTSESWLSRTYDAVSWKKCESKWLWQPQLFLRTDSLTAADAERLVQAFGAAFMAGQDAATWTQGSAGEWRFVNQGGQTGRPDAVVIVPQPMFFYVTDADLDSAYVLANAVARELGLGDLGLSGP